ncbi:MAG: CDP-diacylglycerol--glycerol-3-phosphate 3-phosphatidyltransferase, partial [Pseudomonadota bacterium]
MWNVPNILTVLRLGFAVALPLVFLFVMRPYADWIALILFVVVALTDWLDGYIARAWNQTSKLGAMLDPIADKAMVLIALLALAALFGLNPFVLIPATLIAFREVFVSGLREYLGSDSGKLAVTKVAKWKTAAQMVAISALLASGIFEHHLGMNSFGMDAQMMADIIEGRTPDELGLKSSLLGLQITYYGGLVLLWIAGLLTVYTGWDYLTKAW